MAYDGEKKQILKNLHAVLVYSKERYVNEFEWQDIKLNRKFKTAYRNLLTSKKNSIQYFDHTSVITNRDGQYIIVPNQWFAIASYFVDFCTEMLTYANYFEKIRVHMGVSGGANAKALATHLRTSPTHKDHVNFIASAIDVLKRDFPNSDDDYQRVADNLWTFATDYGWWAGSKTIDRDDFFISPILNQLNVVNAYSEYLARIVYTYASNLNLRILTEHLSDFTEDVSTKEYKPSKLEQESYKEAEAVLVPEKKAETTYCKSISISAASLERFNSMK